MLTHPQEQEFNRRFVAESAENLAGFVPLTRNNRIDCCFESSNMLIGGSSWRAERSHQLSHGNGNAHTVRPDSSKTAQPALVASAEMGEGDGNVGLFSIPDDTGGTGDADGDESAQSAAQQITAAISAATAQAREAAAAMLESLPLGMTGALGSLFGLGDDARAETLSDLDDDTPRLSDLVFEAVGSTVTGAPIELGADCWRCSLRCCRQMTIRIPAGRKMAT